MQTVSISFYRFDGALPKVWALVQMAFTAGRLAHVPDIGFFKVFGTGSRESFHPVQNFGVYAILATWPSLAVAKRRVAEGVVFEDYRRHAAESWTVYLSTVKAWGAWDGRAPFEVAEAPATPVPVGVLTRATLRKRHLAAFWKRVPAISDATVRQDTLMFKLGMGEIPLLHQVTFSVWGDFQSMVRFAYRSGAHKEAVRQVREHGWFKEQLFARFAVLDFEGTWNGVEPLPRTAIADGAATSGERAAEAA